MSADPSDPPVPSPAGAPGPVAASWDAGAMGCGELVMELRFRILSLEPGQILHLTALDPGAPEDLPAWCRMTRHRLVHAAHPHYYLARRGD